jgi:hypothetical protein
MVAASGASSVTKWTDPRQDLEAERTGDEVRV